MHQVPRYSEMFVCMYDETVATSGLGRGSHYSVFRADARRGDGTPGAEAESFIDFAVIWDEDHDTRVIPVIERLYSKGMLDRALFVGERKGSLTVLVDDTYFFGSSRYLLNRYVDRIAAEVSDVDGDSWQSCLGYFSPSRAAGRSDPAWIIQAEEGLAQAYLRSIGVRWQLGPKRSKPPMSSMHDWKPDDRVARVAPRPGAVPDWMVLEQE